MKIFELVSLVGCSQIPLTLRYKIDSHHIGYTLYVSVKPVLGSDYVEVETVRGDEKLYKSLDAVLADIIRIENPDFDDITIKIQISETKKE